MDPEPFAVLFILQNLVLAVFTVLFLALAFWNLKKGARDSENERLLAMQRQRKKYEEQVQGEMRALRETMADLILEMHRERTNAPETTAEERLER